MTTLREAKEFLETVDSGFVFSYGFGHPHSWRGYYDQVSFQAECGVDANSMLLAINEAVSKTFEGWKGGEYKYTLEHVGHLEAGGFGCYTTTAAEDFTAMFEQMKGDWEAFNSQRDIIASLATTSEVKKKATKKRETRAQLMARLDAEVLAQNENEKLEIKETYQTRLLKLLALFMRKAPAYLHVGTNTFVFELKHGQVELPIEFEDDNYFNLKSDVEDAERFMENLLEEERLEEEKRLKKQAALSKLTKEERELLGV